MLIGKFLLEMLTSGSSSDNDIIFDKYENISISKVFALGDVHGIIRVTTMMIADGQQIP